MKEFSQVFNIAGKQIEVSTGKIGFQAAGSIMLKSGGTVLYATASVDNKDAGLDYFPLSVEYIEKMYARGAMSGSKFKKREGLPSDEAIIKAREVDHSIRSLFPKSFKRAVSIVLTVLAYDQKNDPQSLTVLGASLAVMQAGIPFEGPCSSVIVGLDKEHKVIINPERQVRDQLEAEFIVSGVDNKILSFEGWGKEIPESVMENVLDSANSEIVKINDQQTKFITSTGSTLNIDKDAYDNKPAPSELIDIAKKEVYEQLKKAMYVDEKSDRNAGLGLIKTQFIAKMKESESGYTELDMDAAVEYVARGILREGILKDSKRVSNRKLDEIRELKADVDVLPTVHGSALFSRGLTQSLSIVTLAPQSNELLIDDMEGENSKSFFHHYNMPGYANGEASRFNYFPGRREIGHGAIGENALKVVLPSQEDFPYTIRAVSEITSSNGSTSMAATCASCMALMAAGVPITSPVAGIGVGLVTEDGNESNFKLLLDIEGIEDFYGDMDFKVCGTTKGVTAIQYENKLQGVPLSIIKEAFALAKKGREQVLSVMLKTIAAPRESVADNAPKVEKIQIEIDEIGEFIGPGGKNIKGLVAATEQFASSPADIKVDDNGTVTISAYNAAQMNFVKGEINSMFMRPEIGQIYEGEVDSIMNFGAFVKLTPSISGLCHVSEMSDKFVKDPNEIVKKGQIVRVKVIKIENGKIGLTMKGLDKKN